MRHWIYWGEGSPTKNAVYSTDETLPQLKAKYGLNSDCIDWIAETKTRAWVGEYGESSCLVSVSTRLLVYESWREMYRQVHKSVFMNYQHFRKDPEYQAAINLYKPNKGDFYNVQYDGQTYCFEFSLSDLHLIVPPQRGAFKAAWSEFLNVNMLEYETPKDGPLWRGYC